MRVGRVFDSWAILAYAYDDRAADDVENLLVESTRLKNAWITSINLGEVWYSLARRRSRDTANEQLVTLAQIGLECVDVDWSIVRQAADYKSRHKISYADGFAAALAKQRNAELVTGDREFHELKSEIKIHWL